MLIHLEFFPLTAFFPLRYTNGALTAFDTFGGVGHISSTLWSLAFPRNDVPSVFIVLSSCSRPHVVIPMGLSSDPVSQQSLSLSVPLSLSLPAPSEGLKQWDLSLRFLQSNRVMQAPTDHSWSDHLLPPGLHRSDSPPPPSHTQPQTLSALALFLTLSNTD